MEKCRKRSKKLAIMNRNWGWGLQLPPCIALVIFSKLSISNLPACRAVCKSWNHLVLYYAAAASSPLTNPDSAILFYTRGPPPAFPNPKILCFDIDTLSSVASCMLDGPDLNSVSLQNYCNGLMYLHQVDHRIGCAGIFNPMTHEFFSIPFIELHYILLHGFGFSPKTKQYKLFAANFSCNINILRFGSNHNQWTSVPLPCPINLESNGVYMDGVIYWTGKEKQNEYIICALDVETEKFEVIAVLEVGPYSMGAILQPFNGTIYAIVSMSNPSQIQLWSMQTKDSWIRDFIVPGEFPNNAITLVKASKDGKIFLRIMNDLFCLDKSGRMIKIKNLIPYGRRFVGTCLIESLHFGSLSSILAGDD